MRYICENIDAINDDNIGHQEYYDGKLGFIKILDEYFVANNLPPLPPINTISDDMDKSTVRAEVSHLQHCVIGETVG